MIARSSVTGGWPESRHDAVGGPSDRRRDQAGARQCMRTLPGLSGAPGATEGSGTRRCAGFDRLADESLVQLGLAFGSPDRDDLVARLQDSLARDGDGAVLADDAQ